MQAVVRDVRGLGVMFAPQLRTFTCLTAAKEAVQQRASLPELTALLQVSIPEASLRCAAHKHNTGLPCGSNQAAGRSCT